MDFNKVWLVAGCLLLSACAGKKESGWGLGFVREGMLQAQVVKMQIITDQHEFISVLTQSKIGQDGSRRINLYNDAPTVITFCWTSGQQANPHETVMTLEPAVTQRIRDMQGGFSGKRPMILVALGSGGQTKAWLTNGKVDPDARLIYQGTAQKGGDLSFCSASGAGA